MNRPADWSEEWKRLDRALAGGMGIVRDVLRKLSPADRLLMIGKCNLILDALESQAVAEELDAGTPTRKVEDIVHSARGGQTSKRTVKKKTQRGAVIRENPELGSKMASGTLSDEQVDVIAEASAKTNGDAAHNTELIDQIAAAPPEQGKKIADKFVRDRMSQDDVDTAYERARRARRVSRYSNEERGTDVLLIEGAPIDIDAIESRIDALSERLYRDDGGRDVEAGKHRRTRDQRRFDAAMALLSGDSADSPAVSTEAAKRESAKVPSGKPVVVIKASLDQARGTDNAPLLLADGQPLPGPVAERLACGADMLGQVFDADGEILWQGRSVRAATFGQRLALISRDGGCVRCGLGHSKCVVHHLDPWTSRLRGKTDVDRMALVCNDCHHHIHDNELTLYGDIAGIWRLRPARPEEIAAKGPPRVEERQRTRSEPMAAGRGAEPGRRTTDRTPAEAPLFIQRE